MVSSPVSGNLVGVQAANGGNVAYVSDSTITRNGTGLYRQARAGLIASGGDNRLVNNTSDGAFGSTVPKL